MEPVTTLTAGAIIQLAFNEFIKSGAGELAKKSLGGTIDSIKKLRATIRSRFKGRERQEAALSAMEQQGSSTTLEKLTEYLGIEMAKDGEFANEIRQIAQQIINIQNQTNTNRQYENYGRDQINIEQIDGNPKIGGS